MSDHELSPAQLEAATHQRRTTDNLLTALEAIGEADWIVETGERTLTLREWLTGWRNWWTLEVDAYRAEHPELVPTPADICREAAGRAEAAGYEWSLVAPKNHPYRSPYQLHIYGRADDVIHAQSMGGQER